MRKRHQSLLDETFDVLIIVPGWIGLILAVALFCLFRYALPLCLPSSGQGFDPFDILRSIFHMVGWLLGSAIMAIWSLAQVLKPFRRL